MKVYKPLAIGLLLMPIVLSLAAYGWKAVVVAIGAGFGGAFLHVWGYERGLEDRIRK